MIVLHSRNEFTALGRILFSLWVKVLVFYASLNKDLFQIGSNALTQGFVFQLCIFCKLSCA